MSSVNSSSAASGDYILPVGMTELQKKITSAVVSSNFSEILSFFDGKEQTRSIYKEKLTRMMDDLNLVACHPYLLLSQLQPSLAGKRAPSAIESMSGKFQSLVTLAKKFNKPDQHVAVVCAAGPTTDLVESVLCDRALNITRYSTQPQQKIYKKDIQKRRGATFHLMPSELKDLKQAVYAAFDVMIVLDNTFDVNSKYGLGLRAQLRDPVIRRPYASVIRLVALNSAQHIQLFKNLSFSEQIASAVVLKKNAGAMPSIVKQFYSKDMSPLSSFVNNPDGPFPLPGLPIIKRVGHREVEKALYLDDEDQYQVDFANRRVGRRRRAHADADEIETGEEESGSDSGNGIAMSDSYIVNGNAEHTAIGAAAELKVPNKRLRVELEDEVLSLFSQLDAFNPFCSRLLVEFNQSLTKCRLSNEEIASHRSLASNREALLEKQREHMQQLAIKVIEIERQKDASQRRSEKLATRNEKLEHEIQEVSGWWDKIAEKLSLSNDEAERGRYFADQLAELQSTSESQQKALESEKAKFQRLQTVADASSQYADAVTKERDALAEQVSELKAKLEDAPVAKEKAALEQVETKNSEIKALKAELESLKESVRVQLASERPSGRTDRRYGGRGGRGSGLNKHLQHPS